MTGARVLPATLPRRCGALLAVLLLLPIGGCGKKGEPSPPGPPGAVTYPKAYPPPP